LWSRTTKDAACSSTDHGGGKRLPDQAADWINPVIAARTTSSRSPSVKPRCSCSRGGRISPASYDLNWCN
jgi:hypothetical protein